MSGWGTAIGWIFDRLPKRKESLLDKRDQLKKEINEIESKIPLSMPDIDRIGRLNKQLQQVETALDRLS